MKNTIKMSLAAAVAVAGLTSNVAAKPLEEAIKNVDISGSVVYRYNDYGDDENSKNKTDNNYKIATSLKSKVNDYVTATVRVVTGTGITSGNSFATLPSDSANDANPSLHVTQANFTVKTDVATVIAGKQGLTTPWTVAIDSDSEEQTGTGLLALVPAGPVTIAAAYFNQTNLDQATAKIAANAINQAAVNSAMAGANIATVGVMGTVGPVALDAWYLDLDDVFSSYTVGAKATVDMFTAELRYAALEIEDKATAGVMNHGNEVDNNIIIAKLGAKMDAFSAYLQYAKTDKDGGLTALDSDAKTTMTGWNTNIHNKADADYFRVGAGMDVMSGLNVSLNYADLDYANDSEETELYTQITHKMGTNLVTYVRLGTYEVEVDGDDTVDATAGRLQVEYKF
ncbi:hypothetical protein ALC152_03530 [Arcobacter sp. 15-2]|uniref:major outer membrane protein n=1 Tax=Arcobacter sp. 15-2 TaxID=3374109 RepID=UPI00399C9F09